jgi:hypothetical protein
LASSNRGLISDCTVLQTEYSYYSIVSSQKGSSVGAIAGENYGLIRRCRLLGRKDAIQANTENIAGGGIVGVNWEGGKIEDCYVRNGPASEYFTMKAGNLALNGGIAGLNHGTLVRCYVARTTVSGQENGPVAAEFGDTSILDNCLWDRQTVSGSCGTLSNELGQAQTTAAMMTKATFAGWDFEKVWDIQEGKDYPFLRPQNGGGPGDVTIPLVTATKVHLAGRLAGASGGMTLTLDGVNVPIAGDGSWKAEIPVNGAQKTVELRAANEQGETSSMTVTINPR